MKKFNNLHKCYLIAEIGVNHNNNIELAKKLIDKAKTAGCDAVKFQTFKAQTLVKPNTEKVKYQKNSINDKEDHYQLLSKLELSNRHNVILKRYCEKKKLYFYQHHMILRVQNL